MSEKNRSEPGTPPRLRLPFEKTKGDPGEWAYDHRLGLCVTVIAYLLFGIVFMSAKIIIAKDYDTTGFYVDMLEDDVSVPERRIVQELAFDNDFSDVRNRASNQNAADMDEKLNAARGTISDEAFREAEEALKRMSSNRSAYEQGLAEQQAMIDRQGKKDGDKERQDVKVKGRVTVSFSLVDPVRNSAYLHVPAYQCEGGGQVRVNITVNRNGDVTRAVVDAASSSDKCLRDMAVGAALSSRFNIDTSAPERHNGYIEYIFIPQ